MDNSNYTSTPKLLRAVLVEDVEDDALLLVDHLEKSGFRLDWQRVDTEPALRSALRQAWDIVFSDYSMPQFSGAQALEVVREIDPDMPFIFVSGTIGEDVAVEAMKAGAQDYVMKGALMRLSPAVERELIEVAARRERRRTEESLKQLSLVVKQAADSVFITDPDGLIEYVNPAFEMLTGYAESEVLGQSSSILRSGRHDDAFYRTMWETVTRGGVYRGTLVNRHRDGGIFYEDRTITPLVDEAGRISHFVSTGRDVTARVQADEERDRVVAILEATPDLVAIMRPDGALIYLNDSGRRRLGLAEGEDVSRRFIQEFFPEGFTDSMAGEIGAEVRRTGVWSGESVVRLAGGQEIPVSQVILAHTDEDGGVEYLSTIIRDISEQKRFEAKLQYRATHDRLTNLPNRFLLADRLGSALERVSRYGRCLAVLFLDLDNFKRVNDSLGHPAGDGVLQAVARRLQDCLRPTDTVARHGGDEFTILLDDLSTPDDVLVVLHKMHTAFERPVIGGSHEIYITFSAGIAVYPQDGKDAEDLLRNADTAMYRAKTAGPSQYSFYAVDMNARSHELLSLEADLRRALERGEFRLYYQPQVELAKGRIVGMEALIRWQHPSHGLISPADFVPLLENTGLIGPVGEWVLRQACADLQTCRESGFPDLRVSANVSAAQFDDMGLLRKVRGALEGQGVPPSALELELTENIVMRDPRAAAEILRALRNLGVRIAVDDFGTGYSSLNYLKTFPLDVLKIDQTFIGDLMEDSSDAAIVEASIVFAHKLGLETVAEGVETREQLAFLRKHGCQMVQGYYLSRPIPFAEFFDLLQEGRRW
ncbi:MAG: EAL domain-containing protein [Acidihalobacter sp.]